MRKPVLGIVLVGVAVVGLVRLSAAQAAKAAG